MTKQTKFIISIIIFLLAIWSLFFYYVTFVGMPDYFGFGAGLFVIETLPLMLLLSILFTVFVAKKFSQPILMSLPVVIIAFIVTPILLSIPFHLINSQIDGLVQKGLSTNNPYYCQLNVKIRKTYTASKSGNECLVKLALDSNSIAMCDSIKNSEFKFNCYREMANKNNDLSLCEKLTGLVREPSYTEFTDKCYDTISKRISDSSLCDLIKTNTAKVNCYKNFAYKNIDPSFCKKLIGLGEKNSTDCLHKKTGQLTDCYYFFSDECYDTLTEISNNPLYCSMINDAQLKNLCLFSIK